MRGPTVVQLELGPEWTFPHAGSPAEQLVSLLIDCRNARCPFERAWRTSLGRIDWPEEEKARGEWKRALDWAKGEFRDGYRHPESQPNAIMLALASPDELMVDEQAQQIAREAA